MKRRKARERAFQLLFQIDMNEITPQEVIQIAEEEEELKPFAKQLITGVIENKQQLDAHITKHLEKWSLERIASVERTLLRIAVYEMQEIEEIPAKVSINEAVEIAKTYGDDKSSRFVNGVLSKMVNEEV
ncbi:transcription antitermination factor NusB [Salirhabdus salicampi]|uniref:transcription antitermination factor NusB n=1 Tax=Salirhabdus salicampi TaxID=476102 RepID=UPI0020C32FA7|nr:transcription antitermination factor NusB [Salirhabdus salicampi]MCP8616816.1 transcription antitermination factor NusB [Salirhabdus salicampi]